MDTTMKAFFDNASEFNQATDFMFYRCAQFLVMTWQPSVPADAATTACAVFRL
jgi:hypothetical protein